MRVYISGPITGHEGTARDRFQQAEIVIWETYGHQTETINPWKIGIAAAHHAELTQDDYMKLAFAEMDLCDAVYFMDGWEASKGCKQEHIFAINHGMIILKV